MAYRYNSDFRANMGRDSFRRRWKWLGSKGGIGIMKKRMLVIDDDEDILTILNIIFQEEDYEVVLSNTGEAANHLHVIHPDLILLDVRIIGSAKSGPEI